MKQFKLNITKEVGSPVVIYVNADGKEQAIDQGMELIFKRDFREYMRIEKVEALEIN